MCVTVILLSKFALGSIKDFSLLEILLFFLKKKKRFLYVIFHSCLSSAGFNHANLPPRSRGVLADLQTTGTRKLIQI